MTNVLLLLILAGVVAMVVAWLRVSNQLKHVNRRLRKIAMNQEAFDAKIEAANASLNTIGEGMTAVQSAVAAESAQIAEWMEQNPGVNTSGLDGVVARLGAAAEQAGTLATSVGSVFEPPTQEEPTGGGESPE